MKLIIAGSRGPRLESGAYMLEDPMIVSLALARSPFKHIVEEVVSGGAHGIDTAAILFAKQQSYALRTFIVSQDQWNTYGKSAGPKRNAEMASYADGLLAIWDLESRGTKDMIQKMVALRKEVYIYPVVTSNYAPVPSGRAQPISVERSVPTRQ